MESCDLRPLCMCGPFLNGALEKFSNLRQGIYGIWGTYQSMAGNLCDLGLPFCLGCDLRYWRAHQKPPFINYLFICILCEFLSAN